MKKKQRPIAVDLFCGAGGMSVGFEQAGFDVVASFDNDPINVETYKINHPSSSVHRADLGTATGKGLRLLAGLEGVKIDVLFGGPPCQGFSEIGRSRAEDPRNLLLVHFARLVDELRPDYFVLENVRGLLFGRTSHILNDCLKSLEGAGYSIVTPIRVIDASDYGVPQQRRRVFIMGGLKGLPLPDYPDPRHGNSSVGKVPKTTVWEAIGDLPHVERSEEPINTDTFHGKLKTPSNYARILRSEERDHEDKSLTDRYPLGFLTGCSRVLHGPEIVKRFSATEPGTCESVSRLYRLKKDGVSRALRAGTLRPQGAFTAARPIHPTSPRCITVREGARLHSFPDWYQFHVTKWHGFRQIGNAVPPLLARSVAKEIAKLL
ncbi:DNA (cytosine-5)-methyltransferase 1 [Singulisphaera sp. GP187]|uniref:DNA cytosine methyltransferase n=1 Tax=Singulisphaera sp. GP187 TaxID=1882752 RepID=UPI000929C0FB|nr:DNA cytosine methyltransferase [Singulisphaera sp. GP187]SIO62118.1 DNA (cytosine-5)-methyltransferase 1 [Singulisphaera sp. GP187]